jgi:hypothetical protein
LFPHSLTLCFTHFPILPQVYGNKTAVDDELVDILLTPGGDDGAEEVFLKVLRAPAGPSPKQLLPRIQVPIIGIWGVSRCRGRREKRVGRKEDEREG